MIEHFFKYQSAIARHRSGPIGQYIDGFASQLHKRGYSLYCIKHKILSASKLSRWLKKRRIILKKLDEKMIDKFLNYLRKKSQIQDYDAITLKGLLEYLRKCNVVPLPPKKIDKSVKNSIIQDFRKHMKERNLADSTLRRHSRIAQDFLSERFGSSDAVLEDIKPTDITDFVAKQAKRLKPATSRIIVSALRSFFRFLYLCGKIKSELALAVPAVANWRLTTVPKWITQDQIERLLKNCDQSTPVGIRNYAILLLLARLGLRSIDVVNLCLDDIDWESGEIRVSGKNRRQDRLPLPHDVGTAIARYLRESRPKCSSRRVFITVYAPIRGFVGTRGIYKMVYREFKKAGMKPPQMGGHILRHSLASNMLQNGASLGEISEILRHKELTTTQIYTKVDLTSLRKLAQPWPGGKK
jgi:site-specific recombinase XerD